MWRKSGGILSRYSFTGSYSLSLFVKSVSVLVSVTFLFAKIWFNFTFTTEWECEICQEMAIISFIHKLILAQQRRFWIAKGMHKIDRTPFLFYWLMCKSTFVYCHYPCGQNKLQIRVGENSWDTRQGLSLIGLCFIFGVYMRRNNKNRTWTSADCWWLSFYIGSFLFHPDFLTRFMIYALPFPSR